MRMCANGPNTQEWAKGVLLVNDSAYAQEMYGEKGPVLQQAART
jgi:hypothetical protein